MAKGEASVKFRKLQMPFCMAGTLTLAPVLGHSWAALRRPVARQWAEAPGSLGRPGARAMGALGRGGPAWGRLGAWALGFGCAGGLVGAWMSLGAGGRLWGLGAGNAHEQDVCLPSHGALRDGGTWNDFPKDLI